MIKIGIIGSRKQANRIGAVIQSLKKFEWVWCFDPGDYTTWEDTYFSDEYNAFLKQVDSVFICRDTNKAEALIERAIYHFKHVFMDGLWTHQVHSLRDWQTLIYEAGIVFHSGNQLSASPVFLSVWPYLKNCKLVEINISQSFSSSSNFTQLLNQGIEMALKTINGGVKSISKSESNLFGLDFPERFALWIESHGGTTAQISMQHHNEEPSITASFASHNKIFEVDFLTHKVWELKKNTSNCQAGVLFNNQKGLELQNVIPQIQKVQRQVIYFNSLSKELLNFWDNITHNLSPLTGIYELVEVSVISDQIYPKSGSLQYT